MNIILISLFTSLILHGHVNIGFRFRQFVCWVFPKTYTMEELISNQYKILDCLPCMSFWVALIAALWPWWLNSPSEVFAQFDWQQVVATFIIASFYDKLK